MTEKELHKILIRSAETYYNDGEKLITDTEFDKKKDEWEKLTGKRFQVGAKSNVSSTISMSHSYENLAGTLDKVNSLDELNAWLRKLKYAVSKENPLYISFKHDGHSIIFEYKNENLHKALTRGKDGVGKDLTNYFKKAIGGALSKMSLILDGKPLNDFAIAFEATVEWKNLDKLNLEFNESYKNPRSVVGGVIKEDGLHMAKFLTLVPLKVRGLTKELTREQELQLIKTIEGKKSIIGEFQHEKVSLVAEVDDLYDFLERERFTLPGMIDGIVVEIANEKVRKQLGYTDSRPNFAIALKLPYMEAETNLIDVEWYTDGNSATYTPVAIVKPVKLNGATYQRVSLANLRRFLSMNLYVGTKMALSLRNDVLAWVDRLATTEGETDTKLIPPKKCSSCGEKLKNDGVFLFCDNHGCDLVKIGDIQQFFEKLNIKGIKRETIKKMFDLGYVTDIDSLFDIDYSKLSKEAGFGKILCSKIQEAINNRFNDSPVYDYEIFGSLNIPLISRDRAKIIFKHYSLDEISKTKLDLLEKKIQEIEGIGEIVAAEFIYGLENHISTIRLLKEKCSNFINYSDEFKSIDINSKKYSVCITGALKNFSRDEFKKAVESKGHKMVGGITKKTDYLVTNDTSSGTVKNQEANKLGVKIVNEEEAIKVLGINSRPGRKANIDEEFN